MKDMESSLLKKPEDKPPQTSQTKVKVNRYYGEVNLSVVVKSKMDNEQFLSMFDEDGMRATLTLETPDGKKHKVEVLHVGAEWEEF